MKKVLKKAQKFVFQILSENSHNRLIFHNYNHTLEVVQAAEKIAIGVKLDKADIELLLLAAWFHDIGYIDHYRGHEERSVEIASKFLREHNLNEEQINIVSAAILSTQCPQAPNSLLEKVLCDADMSHTGKKDYLEKCKLLQLEWEFLDQFPPGYSFPESDIEFLSKTKYHTEFAQKEYSNRKGKNILLLQDFYLKKTIEESKEEEKKIREKRKQEIPERGIETMFRVSFRNHISFSSIADNKANIMLSINAIIISISLSTLIPNFADNPALIIPTVLLLLVCITTIIFATLSTRPKISDIKITREDIQSKKPNLLFFGNFHSMPLDEYEWGMEEMMKSKSYLYGSLIKDFYSLGIVLAKKYKYLRICYNVFMFGMIIVIIAFLVMFLLYR